MNAKPKNVSNAKKGDRVRVNIKRWYKMICLISNIE